MHNMCTKPRKAGQVLGYVEEKLRLGQQLLECVEAHVEGGHVSEGLQQVGLEQPRPSEGLGSIKPPADRPFRPKVNGNEHS